MYNTDRPILITEEVDIYEYPEIDTSLVFQESFTITIGDMHSNAMKFLYFLIRHGVLSLGKDKAEGHLLYQLLKRIYLKEVDEITKDDIQQFNQIITQAILHPNQDRKLCLLGDELADRGNNDYFILKIIQKLNSGNINFEILLSNHSIELIEAFETRKNFNPFRVWTTHVLSMVKMQRLIDKKMITIDEVKKMIKEDYLPHVKPISYTLTKQRNSISICSHAGIDLNVVRCLALKHGIVYQDNKVEELANTIDQINEAFSIFRKSGEIHKLYSEHAMYDLGYSGELIDYHDEPYAFLMYNRHHDILGRLDFYNNYLVSFVHGHDSNDIIAPHLFNLDNYLGKYHSKNKGKYTVLVTAGNVLLNINYSLVANITSDQSEKKQRRCCSQWMSLFTDKSLNKEKTHLVKPHF